MNEKMEGYLVENMSRYIDTLESKCAAQQQKIIELQSELVEVYSIIQDCHALLAQVGIEK